MARTRGGLSGQSSLTGVSLSSQGDLDSPPSVVFDDSDLSPDVSLEAVDAPVMVGVVSSVVSVASVAQSQSASVSQASSAASVAGCSSPCSAPLFAVSGWSCIDTG